jgi:hypothetical protein
METQILNERQSVYIYTFRGGRAAAPIIIGADLKIAPVRTVSFKPVRISPEKAPAAPVPPRLGAAGRLAR